MTHIKYACKNNKKILKNDACRQNTARNPSEKANKLNLRYAQYINFNSLCNALIV